MARKKSPQVLRAEARKLIEHAERIEQQRKLKVGELVFQAYREKFKGFDLEGFKREAIKIFGG